MENKYCKASVTGFSLTMMSVLIGHFFIFNDAMIHSENVIMILSGCFGAENQQ